MAQLLCIGDLNLDVAITVPNTLVIGSDNVGTVDTFGGGSAANVAAWAARAGVPTRFIGVVGADVSGDFLIGELAKHGVDVMAIRRADGRTRSVAVIIDAEGERSMVSDLDAALGIELHDLRDDWIDGVDWLHLTAYTLFNEHSRPTFAALIEMARTAGIEFSIDPSAVVLMRNWGEPASLRDAFEGANALFPNRDEAAYLSGLDDPVAAAESLLDIAETVVVTCGAAGAHLAQRGEATVHVPVVQQTGVNALGCGDAFVGGFLAARLQGRDAPACGDAGARSASRAFQLTSAR